MSEKKSIKKVIKSSLILLCKCMIVPFMVFMTYGFFAPILSISYELWLNTWMPVTSITSMIIFVYIAIYERKKESDKKDEK